MNSQFIQGIQFDWNNLDEDSYVRDIQAFQGLETLKFSQPVTFFAGENGSGKSTRLEAIAVAHGFNPEGGTKNYVFSTYDEYPELCDAIRLSKGYRKEKWGYFLRAESFYNVATQEEQYADVEHPSAEYHKQSHGESFLALVHDNFGANGLYLLDEPEAALSPQRQLTLLWEIVRCVKQGRSLSLPAIPPFCWGFLMQKFIVLTKDQFIAALTKKQTAIR
uniref:AAA family ATPase n=1 Tax=uncultured Allisonella sp. TaxID=339338 RepID=UPI0025881CB2|nr:AAA family ATPase [uncultured Allisonella sp.]